MNFIDLVLVLLGYAISCNCSKPITSNATEDALDAEAPLPDTIDTKTMGLDTVVVKLRESAKEIRSRHSGECNPEREEEIFHMLMNFHKELSTLETIAKLIRIANQTCDWRRYMRCDPQQKRCVCGPNAIWLPEKDSMYEGKCYLRLKSPCYKSQQEHRDDKKNVLGIDPPYVECAYEKNVSYCDRICKCINPSSKACQELESIKISRRKAILNALDEFTWANYEDECNYGSNEAIDTRIHSLRSLDVKITNWRHSPNITNELCDIRKGLVCYNQNPNTLGTRGSCNCSKYSTWYNGTCHGIQGSFCELKIWSESESVGEITPCMPELTCLRLIHRGTNRKVSACCYQGAYGYRTFEFMMDNLIFCPLASQKTFPAFWTIFLASIFTLVLSS